jgi:two-component system, NarL family, sensor histidine kinase BarA
MLRGLSLAKKCLLVFGGAIVLVVLLAMTLPWLRMNTLIDEGQLEVSRQMMATWERFNPDPIPETVKRENPLVSQPWTPFKFNISTGQQNRAGIDARELGIDQAKIDTDDFVRRALSAFEKDPARMDYQESSWASTTREYRYAKAIRRPVRNPDGTAGEVRLLSLVELNRRSVSATNMLVLNTSYVVGAGAFVLIFGLLVFWIITRLLVLSPVEKLTLAAERVRQGNQGIRAELHTGDEFQRLAETFNSMLTDVQAGQDRLRAINAALDVKLHELSETNTALYQTAKMKGEFLANVSHELRTPLNSINGFAELLMEIARSDAEKQDPPASVAKRIRYLENISTAGKNLLGLINTLLEMARIEAGKVDLRVERVNLKDACEGLLGLISPQAERKGVVLELDVGDDLPVVQTDPRKFQQIIFNFLSNSLKFSQPTEKSGIEPRIVLRAERLPSASASSEDRIRVSVIDNGPGIAKDEQDRIFEKFYQVGGGHTREQSGTGLGLAISKDLAGLLQGEIQLVSDVGRGSMFSLILPMTIAAGGGAVGGESVQGEVRSLPVVV